MPLDAIILLGWMAENEAVNTLCKECFFDPPLTEERAKEVWRGYNSAVRTLPERDARPPDELELDGRERERVESFLAHHRKSGNRRFTRVVKLNPSSLLAG